LSRIIFGLLRTGQENGVLPTPKFKTFPWFAAGVWAIVLWLFEHHKSTLQPSLQSSMTYLYSDSEKWNSLRNFVIYNK
jgi:peroxisomal membrane protein 4